MSFSSSPRKTPLAGHWTGKVATSRWCRRCERLHTTRRHAKGEEVCPNLPEEVGARTSAPAFLRLKHRGPTDPFTGKPK